MKKFILSAAAFALVAVSGITLAPTTASAIPAFARQTGAACFSCHFQEVPMLKAFGRAFKMNSFTDMGDQALVEDDNLSVPVVMNASFVVRGDMTHTSGGGNATATVYNIPVDQNLLIAGRAGSNTGVFIEFGGGSADTATGGINNLQVMNSFDVGGFKVGIGYADSGFGADAVLNVNNVYGQHAGAISGLGADISAVQNSGFTNSMSAIGAWIGNDMGFVQFALIAPGGGAGWTDFAGGADTGGSVTDGNVNVKLKLAKLVKVAATLDVGGFDTILGFATVAGHVGSPSAAEMNEQFFYGQMQGELGDMSLGIYGDWAHAKGKTGGNLLGAQDVTGGAAAALGTTPGGAAGSGTFAFLNQNQKFDAFSIRATLEPISRLTLGAGYGYRKTTDSVTATNGTKHQVYALGAAYSIYQNMILSLKYTSDKQTTPGSAGMNTKTTVLDYVIYL